MQDVPAWDGFVAWLSEGSVLTVLWSLVICELCRVPLTLLQAKQRDVDLIAHGQLSPQRDDRRYAVFRKHSLPRCGRSTAASTEGVDSGPSDRGSAPEACEIGGLGTPEQFCGTGRPRGRVVLRFLRRGERLESVGDLLWPGRGATSSGTRCLVRCEPCA